MRDRGGGSSGGGRGLVEGGGRSFLLFVLAPKSELSAASRGGDCSSAAPLSSADACSRLLPAASPSSIASP